MHFSLPAPQEAKLRELEAELAVARNGKEAARQAPLSASRPASRTKSLWGLG